MTDSRQQLEATVQREILDRLVANAKGEAAAESAKRVEEMKKSLQAAVGYMTNAVIDLQTGTKKQTTINTLNGGIKMAAEAIARAEA